MSWFSKSQLSPEMQDEFDSAWPDAPKAADKGSVKEMFVALDRGDNVIVRGYGQDLGFTSDKNALRLQQWEANILYRHGFRPACTAFVPQKAGVFSQGEQVVTYVREENDGL